MNINNLMRNRRVGNRNRSSVQNLNSFKSSHINKSIDEKLKRRQSACESSRNAKISERNSK